MTPFYLPVGEYRVAAIFEEGKAPHKGIAVLLVPPFGWDDQTAYRPRRDWSVALGEQGFSNLRIDFPGTGDSSGSDTDDHLVEAWTRSVHEGVRFLKSAGASRVAIIALGLGGLVALNAMAQGVRVEDLVIWGMPANGRMLIREFKAFSRFEQSQTGEPETGRAPGELRAGGHAFSDQTLDALLQLDSLELSTKLSVERALLLGRDGAGPDERLAEALRAKGTNVETDPGRGWGIALARAQSASPFPIFSVVNAWLSRASNEADALDLPKLAESATFGREGVQVRESAVIFEGAGQQLFAIVSEPVDVPPRGGTIILFNAGAIRRIGPNRMWTEAARSWAARGLHVMRVDVEGIGDAGGEGTQYELDESFYTGALVAQAKAAIALAEARSLPQSFVLGGLCSGGFWAYQLALGDPRVKGVMALNPRMLVFDATIEGGRELRRLGRVFTREGLRKLLAKKGQVARLSRLILFLAKSPPRLVRKVRSSTSDPLIEGFQMLYRRGQRVDLGFSDEEPLHDEWTKDGRVTELEALGATFHALPFKSHTLKPILAQKAGRAMLEVVVERSFFA